MNLLKKQSLKLNEHIKNWSEIKNQILKSKNDLTGSDFLHFSTLVNSTASLNF